MLVMRLNDGLIVHSNKEFIKKLGYTDDELIEKNYRGIDLYQDPEEHNNIVNELSEKCLYDSREVIFRKKDGTFITVLMSSEIVDLEAGKYILSNIHNIIGYRERESKTNIALELKEKLLAELLIANKELVYQTQEKADRAGELSIANKELVYQTQEKADRAGELLIANKELVYQTQEKADRAGELSIANIELVFQTKEKAKRAAELIIADRELVFQMKEKADRAAELLIANIELVFQNDEKAKRAAELIIANKELVYQTQEKADRAEELIIANTVNQELVTQNDEILFLSYHDQLTGLYNRRFYNLQLKKLDTVENLPFTLIVGDINGLKKVNDSLGHSTGDHLLKKSAEVIKKVCGADHTVYRIGGDEFVVLLPKTKTSEAEQIIKQISEQLLLEKIGSSVISMAFGCETKNNKEENIQEVFKNADKQMYNDKKFQSVNMNDNIGDIIINNFDEKDKSLEHHSQEVSKLCELMGEALRLSKHKINELKTVGLLHDIGKVLINENVLNKSGKLTSDDWKEIKRHPEIGYRILKMSSGMSKVAEYVLSHHERWDGKGYPNRLKAQEIPFESRIIAIVGAYDAMTSDTIYDKAMSVEDAVVELQNSAGTQFDPELVIVFIEQVLGE